jgi:hypothetical protein
MRSHSSVAKDSVTISQLFDSLPKLFTNSDEYPGKQQQRQQQWQQQHHKREEDIEIKIIKKETKRKKELDVDLLLSPDGLQAIYDNFPKKCKFRGRGFEASDLRNLIGSYKLWAWMLLPGTAFVDFIPKCEKLGSDKRMRAAMDQWRQEENEENRRFHLRQKTIPIRKTVSFQIPLSYANTISIPSTPDLRKKGDFSSGDEAELSTVNGQLQARDANSVGDGNVRQQKTGKGSDEEQETGKVNSFSTSLTTSWAAC